MLGVSSSRGGNIEIKLASHNHSKVNTSVKTAIKLQAGNQAFVHSE